MPTEFLIQTSQPRLKDATLLLALTGWMDGGLVSTGTVRHLMAGRDAKEFARIDPDPFYIYNFPGSMEIAAVFRPHAKHEDGIVTELDLPTNDFYVSPSADLVFFLGQEPNLRWQAYADCIFAVARESGVSRIVFIGSFGGSVPHTREPRLHGSVSHPRLKPMLKDHGVRLSGYEGPCGFSTFLLAQAPKHDLDMLSLVAEIPGYLQGINPLSIEAVARRLGRILNQPVDLNALRHASDEWEVQVTEAVEKDEKLAATVKKLEEEYDNELIGIPMEEKEGDEEEQEEAEDGCMTR